MRLDGIANKVDGIVNANNSINNTIASIKDDITVVNDSITIVNDSITTSTARHNEFMEIYLHDSMGAYVPPPNVQARMC